MAEADRLTSQFLALRSIPASWGTATIANVGARTLYVEDGNHTRVKIRMRANSYFRRNVLRTLVHKRPMWYACTIKVERNYPGGETNALTSFHHFDVLHPLARRDCLERVKIMSHRGQPSVVSDT